jgi:hypothetical protein
MAPGQEGRQRKWTKPPRRALEPGRYAMSNDPSTWGSHADPVAAVAAGNADGIGFMLLKSEIAAGDLDHCRDPETGMVDAWAEMLHSEANGAYREITVSGCGLRIIGLANGSEVHRKFTFDRKTGAGLELYRNTGRYITISGCEIGSCTKLPPLDNFIDAIFARQSSAAGGAQARKRTGGNGSHTNGSNTNGSNTNGLDFNSAGPQSSSIDYDEVIRNGAPNGSRSELFQACVWHLAATRRSIEEIVAVLEQYPNGIGEKYAGRLRAEVERSYEKWQAERTIAADSDDAGDAGDGSDSAAVGPPPEPNTWDEVDKNGVPRPTCTNAKRALNALGITCRRDAFHDRFLIKGKVVPDRDNLDLTIIDLRDKIKRAFDFDPGTQNVRDAVVMLCLRSEFDPVCDYLNTLQWDGVPRLDRWLTIYTGAEDTELNREFGRLALIAAVRRARHPGIKFDPILVLEGPMGTGKSAVFVVMAGAENHSDQTILGKSDRDQQELLGGVWIFEIADLAGMKKAEVEHLKAFASRTHDRARPAYGHYLVSQPRRGIVAATTNHDEYLKEADRRFWPVKTTRIDIETLKRDRDQLWAEAAQREREGTSIVLRQELWEAAGIEQQAREEADPWDDKLINASGTIEQGEERAPSIDLLETVLGIHIGKQRDIDYKRLGRCMRRLGWDGPKKTRVAGKQVKGYTRSIKGDS